MGRTESLDGKNLCLHHGRRQWRTFLAAEPRRDAEASGAASLRADAAGGNGAAGRAGAARRSYFRPDQRRANRGCRAAAAASAARTSSSRNRPSATPRPACALGTALVRNLDPEAVVVFLPADALIKDAATFAAQLEKASALAAAEETIVTFGIRPDHASTRFGYLEAGAAAAGKHGATCPVFQRETLCGKTRRGAGGNLFRHRKLLLERGDFPLEDRHFFARGETAPARARALHRGISQDQRSDAYHRGEISRRCRRFRSITRSWKRPRRIAVAEARFDWDDMGSWTALPAHLPARRAGQHGARARSRSTIRTAISSFRKSG